uniref:BED-type domain-containing protein n=1 Tax=Meloidogyne hapla TaxID=6305 RepID=A0A1I8B621_MELHA
MSLIWKYFSLPGRVAFCKNCNFSKNHPPRSPTNFLISHLRSSHPELYDELYVILMDFGQVFDVYEDETEEALLKESNSNIPKPSVRQFENTPQNNLVLRQGLRQRRRFHPSIPINFVNGGN